MLIGYDKEGEIKFYFTDEDYLKKQFPDNTAKVSNFWKIKNHGLKEIFIDQKEFKEDIKLYKITDGKLIKKIVVVKPESESTIIDISKNPPPVKKINPNLKTKLPNLLDILPESHEGYSENSKWYKKEAV